MKTIFIIKDNNNNLILLPNTNGQDDTGYIYHYCHDDEVIAFKEDLNNILFYDFEFGNGSDDMTIRCDEVNIDNVHYCILGEINFRGETSRVFNFYGEISKQAIINFMNSVH